MYIPVVKCLLLCGEQLVWHTTRLEALLFGWVLYCRGTAWTDGSAAAVLSCVEVHIFYSLHVLSNKHFSETWLVLGVDCMT